MADIILVHGLLYRTWALQILKWRLQKRGHRVICFGYPTIFRQDSVNATRLAEFCTQSGTGRFHLAGHSLGGLVILHMLRDHPEICPGRVVLLGTPIKGSQVAYRLSGSRVTRMLLGRAMATLVAGAAELPTGLRLGMIAGTKARGLGRLFGPLEKPNDGTVAVSETVSEFLSDHVQIPVSHTGLLLSREVAEQVANFIANGSFTLD